MVAGSLGSSITDPAVFLLGASGGVYAVLTPHFASVLLVSSLVLKKKYSWVIHIRYFLSAMPVAHGFLYW